MNKLTAAHPDLPFGSMVRVTNLKNFKSVVVRVNDRGPGVRGRIIDVSREVARRLGFEKAGLAEVSLEIVYFSDISRPSNREDRDAVPMPPHQTREQLSQKVDFTHRKLRIPSASAIAQMSAEEIPEAGTPIQISGQNQGALVGDSQAVEYDFQRRVARKLGAAVLFLTRRASPSPTYAFY